MVEGAPLLRAYGPKAHRGFESLTLRHPLFINQEVRVKSGSYIPKNIPNAKRLVLVAEAAVGWRIDAGRLVGQLNSGAVRRQISDGGPPPRGYPPDFI